MSRIKSFLACNRWLLLILVVAAAARFYNLGFQSIWMDEIYTMNITDPKLSYSQMISEINLREGFPYLYFLIIKTLHYIFGFDPLVIRTFSVLAGLAGVIMIYILGKNIFSKNIGLVAALLTTLSEYAIYSSQDGRPYTFYFFGILLSFNTLVNLLRKPTLKNGLWYGLATALLLNTNFFSIVNLFSQSIIILFFLFVMNPEKRLPLFKYSLIGGLLSLVLFIPNYQILVKLMAFKSNWIPLPQPDSFTLIFRELVGNSEMTLFIMIPLFFFFLWKTFENKETSSYEDFINDRKIFGFVILSIWTVVVIMVIFIKTFLDTSLLVSRYFISILPVFLLVLAAAISWIYNSYVKGIVLFCLAFFMAANTLVVKQYYWTASKTQFREASNFVINNNKANEPVFTSLKYWYDHFFDKANVSYDLIEKPSLESVLNEMATDTTKISAFWYVEAHGRPFELTENAKSFLEKHFYTENNFDGLDAWARHYVKIDDAPTTIDLSKFDINKQSSGTQFNSSIENYVDNGNQITVSGWAYFPDQIAINSKVNLLLIKDETSVLLPTQKVNRPDVTSYFKSSFNIDNSGFSVTFDKSKLESGTYVLAIHIVNDATNKEGLFITDKIVNK